jgi:hypothetical protein
MKSLEDCIAALDRIEREVQDVSAIVSGIHGPLEAPEYVRDAINCEVGEPIQDLVRQVQNLQWDMRHLAAQPRGRGK